MDCALPRPLSLPPLHIAALWLILALVNAWFTGWTLYETSIVGFPETDWQIFKDGVASGYDSKYRWSPLLIGPLALVTTLPFGVWVILHVAAAFALPSWPMRALTLVSWPFVQDVATGNVMTFVLLAAVYAMRGNRWAIIGFWTIAVLVPRPLMIPLAALLFCQRPDLRFVGVLIAIVLPLGVIVDPTWLAVLVSSGGDMTNSYNYGPSAIIGVAWVPIGLTLAVLLTITGRLGFASLAASPYWLPYYGLIALLEVRPRRE